MTFAQICVKVRMCYSGRRAISFCCRESMFPNGRRNSSALSGPIDCLNLQSSFLPLTVYGRPAHQEGRRFCTHSLRRLFRCFPGSSHSSWKGALLLSTPAHGSLSCVKTNSVSFASAQARKRKIRSLLRRGRRARRARFPTCGAVRVAGYSVVWACDPTPIFLLKSTKRSAAAIFGRSAPSLRFMVRFGIFCCRQDFLLCFT